MLFELGQASDEIGLEHRIVPDGLTEQVPDLVEIARLFDCVEYQRVRITFLMLFHSGHPQFTFI